MDKTMEATAPNSSLDLKQRSLSKAGVLWMGGLLMLLALSLPGLLADGFHVGKHEGDTLHLIEILERLRMGQEIHRDFVTPIGVLSVAPMAWMRDLGLSMGAAFFAAQAFVAALLLPAAIWVGLSRLSTGVALGFIGVITVFCTALVHGETHSGLSISMHYNRWAWALSFLAITLALLPATHRQNAILDGALIGAAMALLALMKVTYFIALAPGIALALVLRREFTTILWAALAGLSVALAMTLWQGVAYWAAYLGDLMQVAGSEVRPKPGDSFAAVVGSPAGIGTTLVVLLAVIFLRQARVQAQGVALLVLAPGLFYITYQNFGNDPQWIMVLPVLLLSLRPESGVMNGFGWDMRQAISGLAIAAIALGAASFFNMAQSPFRLIKTPMEDTTPLVPSLTDLRQPIPRAYAVVAEIPLSAPGAIFERFAGAVEVDPPVEINGEVLSACRQQMGLKSFFEAAARDLERGGFAGSGIFFADLFGSVWLYGDFRPLKGGAPWYYGGLPGWEDADYLAVASCPTAPNIVREVVTALDAQGTELREIWRSDVLILYARQS